MTIRHGARSFMLLCLIVATPSLSIAAESIAEAPRRPSIRSTDRRLRSLLEQGVRTSPTLRALVARLHASDVVVYLQYGQLPSGLQGRLTFLTEAAGLRYVMVEVARDLDAPRLIAIVGHELQHAVEILEQPQIVSQATFASAYERSGFKRRQFGDGAVGYDTHAAVNVGRQVLRELAGSAIALATR